MTKATPMLPPWGIPEGDLQLLITRGRRSGELTMDDVVDVLRTIEFTADVIEFALFDPEGCGMTAGANRNALLLHSVGDMVLSVDDDTVCSVAESPRLRDGLALSSGANPTDFRFFPDREAAVVVRPKRLVVHVDPRDPNERCWRCDAIALTRRAG